MLLVSELLQVLSLLHFILLHYCLSGTRFIGCTVLFWRALSCSTVDQLYGHYAACYLLLHLSPLGNGDDNSHFSITQGKTSVSPDCRCNSARALVLVPLVPLLGKLVVHPYSKLYSRCRPDALGTGEKLYEIKQKNGTNVLITTCLARKSVVCSEA